MIDSDFEFLMKNPDFVHGYAMSRVHEGQELSNILKIASAHFSGNAAAIIQGYIDGSDAWEDWESRIYEAEWSVNLRNSKAERGAYVYLCAGTDSTYRIRVEKYGSPYGWAGGRVLWDFDQDNEADAVKIAKRWVDEEVLPDGFKD